MDDAAGRRHLWPDSTLGAQQQDGHVFPHKKLQRTVMSRKGQRAWRVVFLDNDETLGYWIPLIRLYTFVFEGKTANIAKEDFPKLKRLLVDRIVQSGMMDQYARPHLKRFLKFLQRMKQRGDLNEVSMFTAASDDSGWVTFLKRLLEAYADVPGLYDHVHTIYSVRPHVARRTGQKFIDDVTNPKNREVVFVDDRVHEVVHTDQPKSVDMIHVEPYFIQHEEERDLKMYQKVLENIVPASRVPSYKIDTRLRNEPLRDQTDADLDRVIKYLRRKWSTRVRGSSPRSSKSSRSPRRRSHLDVLRSPTRLVDVLYKRQSR